MTGTAVILVIFILSIFYVFVVNYLYGCTFKIMTVIAEIALLFDEWSTCAMTIGTGISKNSYMLVMNANTIITLQFMT